MNATYRHQTAAPHEPRPAPSVPKRILVAMDDSPASAAALRWARTCLAPGGHITIVHAVAPVQGLLRDSTALAPTHWREHLHATIRDRWCAHLVDEGVSFEVRLVERGIASAILQVTDAEHPDLIVVGAHRHHQSVRHSQATLAAHLDHRAPCPVLCVPCADEDEAAAVAGANPA